VLVGIWADFVDEQLAQKHSKGMPVQEILEQANFWETNLCGSMAGGLIHDCSQSKLFQTQKAKLDKSKLPQLLSETAFLKQKYDYSSAADFVG
jgi:lipoprotein NlpI